MKIARTQNAVRNIVFGSVNKVISIVLPFFSRTVILYLLGTQYLGLSSLFTSILSFLSLTELGVGAAMVFSMYKPIAENDDAAICALLKLYKKCYAVIGTIILAIGLALMPVLDLLVDEELPDDINLYVLYCIYLLNAVLSYWLFAYKNALLQAFQRNDVNSKISSVLVPASYAVMLSTLALTRNYYTYILWEPIFTILTNLLRMRFVNRHFPQYRPEGEVSEALKASIVKKTTALIGTKLNTVVLHAADNIVMTAFLGLTTVAVYGNYYLIMTSIIGFLGIIYASMTAGLGNSFATESVEKNYRDFEKFSFLNAWIVGWCSICLLCLYQPFMEIWTKGKLLFPFSIVLQFVLYFYVYQIRKIPVVYKDAAGIWWEDRFRPYVCMVVNLVLNIILVQTIGISGILLSTVFSLFLSIPWENYTIFRYVFHRSSRTYYLKMAYYLFATVLSGIAAFALCRWFPLGIIWFLVRMAVCVTVPNLIFVLLNFRSEEFRASLHLIKHILGMRKIER